MELPKSSFSVTEREALRKMVLLRWSGVGAVSAGCKTGYAVGGLFRRIARGRGARIKSGVRRQGQDSVSRDEGRRGLLEAGWASEGLASEDWASEWRGLAAATVACLLLRRQQPDSEDGVAAHRAPGAAVVREPGRVVLTALLPPL